MNPRISFAQHGEDIVLARALRGVSGITYCDVGAAHPVVDSISRSLHALGWKGIHVEPVPSYATLLRDQRPGDVVVECGAGAANGELEFWFVPGSGLSTISRAEADEATRRGFAVHRSMISVRRLAEILDEHLFDRPLHVLKVDVEGAERDVLLGAELARFRPWIVVVEATRPGSTETTHRLWESLVIEAGYTFALFDGLNRWYCSIEHAELLPSLSYPACPLDGWIRAGFGYPTPVGGDTAEVQMMALLELATVSAQMRAASGEVARLTARNSKLEERSAQLSVDLEAATEKSVRLGAELRAAHARVSAMHNSRWWRLTAPGRRITAALKRRRRR